jgi:6-phosphogluconolactonase
MCILICEVLWYHYKDTSVSKSSKIYNLTGGSRMKKTNLTIGNAEEVTTKLGIYVKDLAESVVRRRGMFTVGLSGGSSIEVLSKALVKKEIKESIDWTKWNVFWVDERCVSKNSPLSNYGRAKELLLDHVDIPKNQIYSCNGIINPDKAVIAYEQELSKVFSETRYEGFPRFDLIVLGVGKDGHIASLFPGHSALKEKKRMVYPITNSIKPPKSRITLTLPLINSAYNVAFVVFGKSKSSIIKEIFIENHRNILPAAMVEPDDGEIEWFVDDDAGRELDN